MRHSGSSTAVSRFGAVWRQVSWQKWALLGAAALISCSSDDPGRADEQHLEGGELEPADPVFEPFVEGTGGSGAATNYGSSANISPFGDDSFKQFIDPPREVSQYCGDGAYDPELEECDDGVGEGLDVCSQDCQTRDLLAVPAVEGGEDLSRKLGLGRHPISGGPLGSALTWVDTSAAPQVVVQLRDVYGNRASSASPAEVVVADAALAGEEDSRPVIASNPVVATLPDGTHVVAYNDLNGDGNELGVALRPVAHLTGTLGDVQYANTTTIGAQHDADLLWTEDGLIAAWVDTSDDLNGPDIRYRIYDEDLVPLSEELTLAGSYQPEASVTLSPASGSASWAAAWRRGEAGSNEDAHESIVVSHDGQQIEFIPRVATLGGAPSAEVDDGMGGADPGFNFVMPGHIDDRLGLAPLGDDLFAVAFTVGTDPDGTGVANVFRLWVAVVDFVAGDVVWIDELEGPGDDTRRQRSPALVDASLSSTPGASGSVFLSWREDSPLGTKDAQELWLTRLAWDSGTSTLTVADEVSLARNEESRPGNQRRPALANVFVPGGRALSMAWEDWGVNFDTTETAQGRPDIAIQVAPIPLRRDPNKRAECSPLELCALGVGHCEVDDDCLGGLICANRRGPWHGYGPATGVCEPAHCSDGFRSGGEVDVDCGGDCGPCFECLGESSSLGTAHYCSAVCPCAGTESDCDSDYDCEFHEDEPLSCVEDAGDRLGLPKPIDVCLTEECNDGTQNGDETGIDCGGSDCPACAPGTETYCSAGNCGEGEGSCTSDSDCAGTLVCGAGQGIYYGLPSGTGACVPAECADRPAQFEPDACTNDCKCGTGGGSCSVDADCLGETTCQAGRGIYYGASSLASMCVADQCFNGVKDANEQQVDCGGPCGAQCSVCNGDSSVPNFEQAVELWEDPVGGISIANSSSGTYGAGSVELSGCEASTTLRSAPFAGDVFDVLGDDFLLDIVHLDGIGTDAGVTGPTDIVVGLRTGGVTTDLVHTQLAASPDGETVRLAAALPSSLREAIASAATDLQVEVRVQLDCTDPGLAGAFLRLDHMQLGGANQSFRSVCSPGAGQVVTDEAVLGFEDVSLWPSSGLTLNTTDVRQGAGSAQRAADAHTITSDPISLGYDTTTRLLLDVNLDGATNGATFTTTLSCPSSGVYAVDSEIVAAAQAGDWVTLPFHLADAEIAKLANAATDCTVSIQTAPNVTSGNIVYDHLRFVAPGHCADYQQIDALPFAVGMGTAQNGTEDFPYRLCTAAQVQTVMDSSSLWSGNIELEADIDLTGVSGQLGTSSIAYQGTFNGKGHVLSNYYLDATGSDHVGFFGRLTGDGVIDQVTDGVVRNLTISEFEVLGLNYVGALVGTASAAVVEDVYSVNMDVDARAYAGVIGWATASTNVSGVYSSGDVDATDSKAGGLVGELLNSNLVESASSATVDSVDSGEIGGAVGYLAPGGTIDSVSASGDVATGVGDEVGGLVGYADDLSVISNSSASGAVQGGAQVGGLVGQLRPGSTVSNCVAAGSATGTGNNVGGLIGQVQSSELIDCSASGAVSGQSQVGGLAGVLSSTSEARRVFATGDVTASAAYAGGLVGYCHETTIDDAFATGDATSISTFSGGLVGFFRECSLSRVHAMGQATGGSIAGPQNDEMELSVFTDAFGSADLDPARNPVASAGYGGTNLATAQFTDPTNFTNFDFFTTWEMGETHPELKRGWCQLYDQQDDFSLVVGSYVPNGDADAPYVLCHPEQVQWLMDHTAYWDENFILGADIDLTTANGTIGTSSVKFTGTFDGAGRKLSNYVGSYSQSYGGLFSYTQADAVEDGHLDGILKNLVIEDFDVSVTTGGIYAFGSLVGSSYGHIRDVVVRRSTVTGLPGTGSDFGGVAGWTGGEVTRVTVEDVDVTCPWGRCGGIVGQHFGSGIIEDSHVLSGTVSDGVAYMGGLVGQNSAIIRDSHSAASVSGTTQDVGGAVGRLLGAGAEMDGVSSSGLVSGAGDVGGLVGQAQEGARITNCSSSSRVESPSHAGGLVGYLADVGDPVEVTDSEASGEVYSDARAGGLVAQVSGPHEISRSRATGFVFGTWRSGGFAAQLDGGAIVTDSSALGTVYTEGDHVGGFVGHLGDAIIERSEAYGDVTKNGGTRVGGGFAGYVQGGTVRDSAAYGDVDGGASQEIGGFVGRTYETTLIERCEAHGDVEGTDTYVGGLVGYLDEEGVLVDGAAHGDVAGGVRVGGAVGYSLPNSTIRETHANGQVRATGDYAGGLVGDLYGGLVEDSSARGTVLAADHAGGLIGYARGGATVLRSFATGDSRAENTVAGGLAGRLQVASVLDSYSAGHVTTGQEGAGGLIGSIESSTITNSYARGIVVSGNQTDQGTVIATSVGADSVFASVFGNGEANTDTEVVPAVTLDPVSGFPSQVGVANLSESELATQSSFTGWDFDNTWQMGAKGPTLRSGYCIKTDQQDGAPFAVVAEGQTVPNGTANAPYILCNAQQFASVVADSNLWGDYFELGQNIDISAIAGGIGTDAQDDAFTGTFDGKGFALIGYQPTVGGDYKGLFGYVEGDGVIDGEGDGRIANLELLSPVVSGDAHVGALAGYVENGAIENVIVTDATVTGADDYVGGLVGQLTGSDSIISGSEAAALVNGVDYVGGLVGFADDGAFIEGSRSSGSALAQTAPASRVGGLVGDMNAVSLWDSHSTSVVDVAGPYGGGLIGRATDSALAVCSAAGDVDALDFAGGLIGEAVNTSISRCWATGEVTASNLYAGGLLGAVVDGIVTDSYATGAVSGAGSVGGLIGDAKGTSVTRVYAKGGATETGAGDPGALIGTADGDVYLASAFGSTTAHAGLAAIGNQTAADASLITDSEFGDWNTFASAGWEFGSVWSSGADGPTLGGSGGDVSDEPCIRYVHDTSAAGTFLVGMPTDPDGSVENPWPLCSAEHIGWVISGDPNRWDDHFVLHADVNLQGVTGQIGSALVPFSGTFDGRSHRLSNFVRSSLGTDHTALFHQVDGDGQASGVVKNLVLDGFEFQTGGDSGLLVGALNGGLVQGVQATRSTLTTNGENTGGLVGFSDGTIRDVDVDVAITSGGTSYVGGLVGNNQGHIEGAVSRGDLATTSGAWRIGGLVGQHTGSIVDSTATGSVSGGFSGTVGGLVGYVSSAARVINSSASGSITATGAPIYVGGLVGHLAGGLVGGVSATGAVQGETDVGGLVGFVGYGSRIRDSRSAGTVAGVDRVGGLVGRIEPSWSTHVVIERCSSVGDVAGTGDEIGGLVGFAADAVLSDTAAAGSVTGVSKVGALVGTTDDVLLLRSLGLSAVSGVSGVGALIGETDTATQLFNSFASDSAHGALPLVANVGDAVLGAAFATDAELQDSLTFEAEAWDFSNIWELAGAVPSLIDRGGELPFCERYTQTNTAPFVDDPELIPTGTAASPYHICNRAQLDEVGQEPSLWAAYFVLESHLDLASFTASVGNSTTPFTGTFDGQGYSVRGYAGTGDGTVAGLFGAIEGDGNTTGFADGHVTNLLADAFVVIADGTAGGLVGTLTDGTIENVQLRNSVVQSLATPSLGGLVGSNDGVVRNVVSHAGVAADGGGAVGTLTGSSSGTVEDAETWGYAALVNGAGRDDAPVGGVVGLQTAGSLIDLVSHAIAQSDADHVGGVIGDQSGGLIQDSVAHGPVYGLDAAEKTGGFAGRLNATVTNCFAHGDVQGDTKVGGFVGAASGSTLTSAHATGDVVGGYRVGGLVAYMATAGASIYRSSARGNVRGEDRVGGLIGDATNDAANPAAQVHDVLATGAVFATRRRAGGLVGRGRNLDIQRAVTTSAVGAGAEGESGEFIGLNESCTFTDSYSNGDANGSLGKVGSGGGGSPIDSHTLAERRDVADYTGLDLEGPWVMRFNGPALVGDGSEPGVCETHGAGSSLFTTGTGIDGSVENPWRICNGSQAQAAADDTKWGDHFVLEADVDLGGVGAIIGNTTTPFTGVFDGSGHTVSQLGLNGTSDVGLFGYVNGGEVRNLILGDPDVSGASDVGALVGEFVSGTASNNWVLNGDVSGTGDNVGGAIGLNGGTVEGLFVSATVTGTGADDLGGAVGASTGDLTSVLATGDVTLNSGNSAASVGGLVGNLNGAKAEDCHATGLIVSDQQETGGLVGRADGGAEITGCTASGSVTMTASLRGVGGLVGLLEASDITLSSASGDVSAYERIGGLVGTVKTNSTIDQCFATGDVTGTYREVGGLIGYIATTGAIVSQSWSEGDVVGTARVGGFIGYGRSGTVSDSYAIGDVDATNATGIAGGFIGYAREMSGVDRCYSYGQSDLSAGNTNSGEFAGKRSNTPFTANYSNSDANPGLPDVGGGDDSSGVTPKTEAQLGDDSSGYFQWDWVNTWVMDPNAGSQGRPVLQ